MLLDACRAALQRVLPPTLKPAKISQTQRIEYGSHPLQYGILRSPAGGARGTVMLVHGGWWRAGAGADGIPRLARKLVTLGWQTFDIQYRTVGAGGGWPETGQDMLAAIEALHAHAAGSAAGPGPLVMVGHSAGGQLATWAAIQLAEPGTAPYGVAGVVSLAGTLNLRRAAAEAIGGGAAAGFLGGDPATVPEHYDQADPTTLAASKTHRPAPIRMLHGIADTDVPMTQSADFAAAAAAAGWDATLARVPGDHWGVINPAAPSWPHLVAAVGELSAEP